MTRYGGGVMTEEYDLFISHASEDKAPVVLPIVDVLSKFGLRIWLDERVLEVGDSLSEAIDRGLARSRYGVVVLSPAFLSKRSGWPGYELRGLNAKEVGSGKVILPIWHNVSRAEVLDHSPLLADKFALDTSRFSHGEIALRILKVVRPQIFNNLYRWSLFKERFQKGSVEFRPLSELKRGPIRHYTLPKSLLLRARIVHEILSEASYLTLGDLIDNFRRDAYPEEEMRIWENIAAAYAIYTKERSLQQEEKRRVLGTLLSISMQTDETLSHLLKENPKDKELWDLVETYGSVIPKVDQAHEENK
ncbi:MAG TPA: toll/interleukin-1 receptor domain-containing protein [Thermoanaerobaculia bacterium]|nr:toll/interleukin-1 receptor domain-containing protein [Thermoanaerobaculia bacterium]